MVLEALFSSHARVGLLETFLMNPGSSFYARALSKIIGAHYSAIWKELRNLERAGILVSEASGRVKAYSVNPHCAILPELRGIILKTTGLGDRLRQTLTEFGGIRLAFVYGSFAAGEADQTSDVDLMLIGQVDTTRLASAILQVEKKLGRAVNYIAYSPHEWRSRVRARDSFIRNVLVAPKVMVIGTEDGLRTTPTTRTHKAIQGAPRRNPAAAKGRHTRPRHRRAHSAQ